MRIAFLTDIHIGNPKINLPKLHDVFLGMVFPKLAECELILFGGDFFDCLLNINGDAGIFAVSLVDELFELISTRDCWLRVLRGTFSHDRYQNRLFTDRPNGLGNYKGLPKCRTINKVAVESFPDGPIVAYCPDDLPCKDPTDLVLATLEANHLASVDYLCSHGYWDHLLPPAMTIRPHNCLDYNRLGPKITCHVFNGHVHSRGIWNKVVTGGSLERFRHGEEEDKGFYLADWDPATRTDTLTFVKNEKATPFITVDMTVLEKGDRALAYLDRRIHETVKNDYTGPIHIRLLGEGSMILPVIRDRYPNAVVTEKKDPPQRQAKVEFMGSVSDLPIITEDNLPEIIWNNVKDEHPNLTIPNIKELLNYATGI